MTKTAPVLATALLCTAAFAQEQVATPQPLKSIPQATRGLQQGGIAGAVIYQNTTETGSRYAPAAPTTGPLLNVTFDDIPIPLANIGGATTVDVTKVTVGIRRAGTGSAPPGAPCDISAYWATATTEVTDPDTELDQPINLIGSVSLPAPTAAGFTTELVTFGDGTTTLFTVDLNDTVITGGGGPFGTFLLGLTITPGASTPNGWRLTNGPDANADVFWDLDQNTGEENAFFFGAPPAPLAIFYAVIEGAAAVGDPCQQPLAFCNADIAPPGGNGIVDTDDLLGVINTWGNQGPPRPQGDCAPLPNGNCIVNTDDLLEIVNNWGVCDVPTGACCLPNGTCLANQTTAQCSSAGGVYQGNGSPCGTCPVLPANDECSGAIAVVDGLNNVSNLNATTSTGIPGGACAFQGAGNFTKDVWFTYTTTSGGLLEISLCDTAAPVTDTVLSIFSGTCGSLTELLCDDDGCVAPVDLLSSGSATLPGAGTYYIRVGSWANGPSGPIALNVAFTPLSNDVCDFATTIPSLPATVNGDLAGSDLDFSPTCNSVPPGFGRWYKLTGNGNTLTASTCIPCTPGVDCPTWNARLHVYCGPACGGLFCVVGADNNTCSFFQETVTWCSAAGQTYWILVSNPDGPTGAYTLNVTSGAVCNNPVQCGLPNDECAGATTVVNGNNNVDGTGATTSAGIPGGTCTGAAANFTNDSWHKYTPTFTGLTEFKLCNSSPQVDDVLAVLDGTCAALVELGCDDDGCVAGTFAIPSIVSVATTTGNEVFVRVGTWNNTFPGGPRVLTITPGVGGCGPCTGIAEGQPCIVNGAVGGDDPNGGCNSTVPAFPLEITVGDTVCGISSHYTSSTGAQSRDTDWYLFTPKVDGNYVITGCSSWAGSSGLLIGFVSNGTTDVTTCAGGGPLAFLPGASVVPNNTEGTATSALVGGNTYAVFAGPGDFTGGVTCPAPGESNYRITLTGP